MKSAHAKLWGVVEGAVNDAFHKHDDYLTPKGRRSAKVSIIKRVTGTVLGFALQEAQRRQQPAAQPAMVAGPEREASGETTTSGAGDGVSTRHPLDPHCRIGKVRWKRKTRYRSPSAFDLKTTALLAAVKSAGARAVLPRDGR